MSFIRDIAGPALAGNDRVQNLKTRLHAINEDLWRIEDLIRAREGAAAFDDEFVELARAVYKRNDERAGVKREINLVLGSELMEEKSYGRTQPDKDKP